MRSNGRLRFGDDHGEALDRVIVMRRFDENALFERLLRDGRLKTSPIPKEWCMRDSGDPSQALFAAAKRSLEI